MWWGVAAALLANLLYSTGFVLEKRALTAMPSVSVRNPARLLRQVISSPLWIGGSLALYAAHRAGACSSTSRERSATPACTGCHRARASTTRSVAREVRPVGPTSAP